MCWLVTKAKEGVRFKPPTYETDPGCSNGERYPKIYCYGRKIMADE